MPTGDHFRRLTTEQVLEIKSSKEQTKILATRFNVGKSHIRKLRAGLSWKYLNR